jgi:7-carboxy-7-deazaguanine synthase
MFGKNPKLKPNYKDPLRVFKIFSTFQGEGPYLGYAAVFVRLSGCNLACDFCDTDFNDFTEKSLEKILNEAREVFQGDFDKIKPLIVITGGEPMRQNIGPLCQVFIERGHLVQIETNGTLLAPNLPDEVKIVCSPKNIKGHYYQIREDLLKRIKALKFLVSMSHPYYQDIADLGQDLYKIPLYIQPMDQYDPIKNQENLVLAMKLVREKNAILSVQMHKFLGLE